VFNLDQLVPYTAVAEGDSILVTLGAAAPGAQVSQAPNLAPRPGGARSVTGIDFRRSPEGAVGSSCSCPTRERPPASSRKATA
jgi:hypothetical protein